MGERRWRKGDKERQWMRELESGITDSEKTEVEQIREKDLKSISSSQSVTEWHQGEMRQAGVVQGDGEEPGVPPRPASLHALMRGNETDALLGQNLLFWNQREAQCQITNAVVRQQSEESSRLPLSEPNRTRF